MRVQHHIALIIVVCSLGGVGLSVGLGGAWEETDADKARVAMNTVSLNHVGRLRERARKWGRAIEKLVIEQDYHLLETSRLQTLDLRRAIWNLRVDELATGYHQLEDIYSIISRIDNTIRKAFAEGRAGAPSFLADHRADVLAEVSMLQEAVLSFEDFLQARAQVIASELEQRTVWIQQVSLMALIGYGVVVIVLWSWSVFSLVRPLEFLTIAARRSMERGEPFEHDEKGPREVRQLSGNLSTLVRGLQASQDRMEKAIEERTRELVRANKAKSEFLANVSHEIRTPLTAILGYAELAREPHQNEDARLDSLNTIYRNGHHLLEIINDILDLSKIEAGKVTTEHVHFSPIELVKDVAQLMHRRAALKELLFAAEYVGPIPATIESDPTRLRQILINLIGNAIKFTKSGGLRLLIRMMKKPDSAGEYLRFDVADTGVGLERNKQEEIFEPFSQADASTSRKFGGTGLGLTISQSLAQLLGGGIEVTSKPGEGSCFSLGIDTGSLEGVEMLHDLGVVELEDPAAPADPVGEQVQLAGRVLLAEDGEDNRRLLSTVLGNAGLEVEVVNNGRQAVNVAIMAWESGRPFDVILMDMQMPELDGYAATTELREAGYKGPVIALTAHAMIGSRSECLEAGCDDFASKPVERKVLLGLLEEWISSKEDWQGSRS